MDLLIGIAPFYRLLRQIAKHHMVQGQPPRVDELAAMQDPAEYHLVVLLDDANFCVYCD